MKCAVEMRSGTTAYKPSFIKIGSDMYTCADRKMYHTPASVFFFF
jgi:hypothetical protein